MIMAASLSVMVLLCSFVFLYQHKQEKGGWKMMGATGGGLLLGLFFEIYDFPPIFLVVDAHACWHFSTPFVYMLFYSYFEENYCCSEVFFPFLKEGGRGEGKEKGE